MRRLAAAGVIASLLILPTAVQTANAIYCYRGDPPAVYQACLAYNQGIGAQVSNQKQLQYIKGKIRNAQQQIDALYALIASLNKGIAAQQKLIAQTVASINDLDAKLQVRVIDLKDVAAIDLMGRRWSGVDPTDPTNYQGDFVNRMLELSSWLGVAGIGLMVILVVVSIVIVMNTIRTAVYHRRKEIEVMKLVGATEWFVRGPFVIEGVMTGVIAASIALSLLVIAYQPMVDRFHTDLVFIPLTYDPSFISSLARDLLLGGALLGALGSYIGVRRFVRI